MRKILLFFIGLMFLAGIVIAEDAGTAVSTSETSATPETTTSGDDSAVTSSDSSSALGSDIEDVGTEEKTKEKTEEKVEFDVKPGLTPDSPFYFVDNLIEKVSIRDSPERALAYREEKIAEAQIMVNEGKPEEAQEVLDKALEYGDVLEKEADPEMKNKIKRSTEKVKYVLRELKEDTKGSEWDDVDDKFDDAIEKEKKIETAAELSAKIRELCDALAKLDPLQYSDTCRAKENSPKWMKERDEKLTGDQEAQAKLFFEKLSACFEKPENCDCKGMRVQKFEDFCIEKSAIAEKCKNGDENSCAEFDEGDPTDLLPSYLIPVFKKLENRYIKSEFELYIPPECREKEEISPEECNKITFEKDSPQECIDAGLTGKSKEDELKCKKVMFEKNSPKECLDAGISTDDPDAPRKCAKIMFKLNSPQVCIDAGLTGEFRDEQKKCNEIIAGKNPDRKLVPKFSKDCNSIQDNSEKVKCYEEFYNNAQVNMREDFIEREFKEDPSESREFARKMGAANPDQPCPDDVCDKFEKDNPDACPEDCRGERVERGDYKQRCQTPTQVDNLKKECREKGEDAIVENRGGCPWVVCVSGNYQKWGEARKREVVNEGQKCPDGICDDYERMNPYACPEDCGGQRYREEKNYQQPLNRIDIPQQTNQQQQQEPQQQMQEPQEPMQQLVPEPGVQPSQEQEQQIQEPVQQQVVQQPQETVTQATASEDFLGNSGGITGGVIDNSFWDYWFG